MAVVEWTESLSVGQPVLDNHHRHLIALINRLHDVIRDANAVSAVGDVLGELIAYVGYHFAEEEGMMAAAGYPDLAAHRQSHAYLTGAVQEMKAEYDANPRLILAAELFEFLSEWLLRHIRVEDMAFRPWVKN